jgi:adenine-specific DNA-methyltransferase
MAYKSASFPLSGHMSRYDGLENILAELARDVVEKGDGQTLRRAFDAYRTCLEPFVAPYVGDGFLDEQRALSRFFSETATLHLAVSLVAQWCDVHGVGRARGFCDSHPEAALFSWYRVPRPLSCRIRDWAAAHSNIEDVVQAVALVAEGSLAGLRRRALGEFFTPTEIARHLVALAGYDPLTVSAQKVVDPACGSGNLLASVVSTIVQAVQSGSLDPTTALSGMSTNICGFDIQPVATLLARLQLLLASLPILEQSGVRDANVYETLSFRSVRWADPLADPELVWDQFAPYSLVLANPPFMKAARRNLPFVTHYEDILAGQPNLYQLFLWWAIRATRPGGRICFLVPQSMRAGQYLGRLRQAIAESCELTAVTCFRDGTGVFESVDQQMMIVALRKQGEAAKTRRVDVRVSTGAQSLDHLTALNAGLDDVVRMQGAKEVWCVSSEPMDYAIMSKVCGGYSVLGEAGDFKVVNGGLVWNQHKERLRATHSDNTLPLLSSASVGGHQFTFPACSDRVSQRLFVDATPPVPGPVHRNMGILLKRTIAKGPGGRRLVAALLSEDFLVEYGRYFAENHVNLIFAAHAGVPKSHLRGLCAWLNSRLANFVFGMMNGSSHLSKFELELIAVPVPMLPELGDMSSGLQQSALEKRRQILDQIDKHVLCSFGLSLEESLRVAHVVPPTG